jgi:hypothetical protein
MHNVFSRSKYNNRCIEYIWNMWLFRPISFILNGLSTYKRKKMQDIKLKHKNLNEYNDCATKHKLK